MKSAARAIVIEDGKILLMRRDKGSGDYYTLVGGAINENESPEDALFREVREETGLEIVDYKLVFFEDHPSPYKKQYIYLCSVAPHDEIFIQEGTEEATLNRLKANIHEPMWVDTSVFAKLPFATPALHKAILDSIPNGFPEEPTKL